MEGIFDLRITAFKDNLNCLNRNDYLFSVSFSSQTPVFFDGLNVEPDFR